MKPLLSILATGLGLYLLFVLSDVAPEPMHSTVSVLDRLAPQQASLATRLPERRSVSERVNSEANWPGDTALEIAGAYLDAHREAWNIQPYHQMKPELVENPLGSLVKFAVYQGETPVMGMQIQVRIGLRGEIQDVLSDYKPIPEADLNQPMLRADEILAGVSNRFEAVAEGVPAVPVIYVAPGDSGPVAALAMTVRKAGSGEQPVQAIFRASDGQILDLTMARAEFHR